MQRVREAAEKAKCELSSSAQVRRVFERPVGDFAHSLRPMSTFRT